MKFKIKGKSIVVLIIIELILTIPIAAQKENQFIYCQSNQTVTFDFEDGLENWLPIYETNGTEFFNTDQTNYNGDYSACLKGRSRYYYVFDNNITMTNNTMLTFSWGFTNINGHYIGIYIVTTGPNIWFISHFSYLYGNTSAYMVIMYENETSMMWHYHTANLSDIYLDYYGVLPEKIYQIQLYNRGYGPHNGDLPSNQTTLFDYIHISNVGETLPINPSPPLIPATITSPPPNIKFPGFSLIIGLLSISSIILALYIIRRKNKT